jgi:hypothetical protein
MPPTDEQDEGPAMDASRRDGNQIEQETREKVAAEVEWAEAEAHGEDSMAPDGPRPRTGEPTSSEA